MSHVNSETSLGDAEDTNIMSGGLTIRQHALTSPKSVSKVHRPLYMFYLAKNTIKNSS